MSPDAVLLTQSTASSEAILAHLTAAADVRAALLARGVDISAYAAKLARHATTCEAWQDGALVGLVAVYLNDTASRAGFITNLSVLASARRQGIASALLRMCIELALAGQFDSLVLEVSNRNTAAMALYRKFGFQQMDCGGDSRTLRLTL